MKLDELKIGQVIKGPSGATYRVERVKYKRVYLQPLDYPIQHVDSQGMWVDLETLLNYVEQND